MHKTTYGYAFIPKINCNILTLLIRRWYKAIIATNENAARKRYFTMTLISQFLI